MSERRVERTIDVRDGVGSVMAGDQRLTNVHYHLGVTRAYTVVQGPAGTQEMEVPGSTTVRGTLTPQPGDTLPMARLPLTLVMQDSRQIDFTVTGMNGAEYRILGTGALEDGLRTL